jgi:hypothetical protein
MFVGVTAVVSMKDAEAAASVQDKLIRLVESAGVGDPSRRPRVRNFRFAGKTVHVLESGEKNFPLAPAWCLTDKHLIVALYPEAVKAFLARGPKSPSLAQAEAVTSALSGEGQVLAVSYFDTPRLFDRSRGPFPPVAPRRRGAQLAPVRRGHASPGGAKGTRSGPAHQRR